MPSQTSASQIAIPIPRRRSPLLTHESFGQDLTLCFTNTKAKSPASFGLGASDNSDYAPPAPPPPSPVNFPLESWSTACAIRR